MGVSLDYLGRDNDVELSKDAASISVQFALLEKHSPADASYVLAILNAFLMKARLQS